MDQTTGAVFERLRAALNIYEIPGKNHVITFRADFDGKHAEPCGETAFLMSDTDLDSVNSVNKHQAVLSNFNFGGGVGPVFSHVLIQSGTGRLIKRAVAAAASYQSTTLYIGACPIEAHEKNGLWVVPSTGPLFAVLLALRCKMPNQPVTGATTQASNRLALVLDAAPSAGGTIPGGDFVGLPLAGPK